MPHEWKDINPIWEDRNVLTRQQHSGTNTDTTAEHKDLQLRVKVQQFLMNRHQQSVDRNCVSIVTTWGTKCPTVQLTNLHHTACLLWQQLISANKKNMSEKRGLPDGEGGGDRKTHERHGRGREREREILSNNTDKGTGKQVLMNDWHSKHYITMI